MAAVTEEAPPDAGPLVIDSGPVTLQATTGASDEGEEVRDGGDRPGAGE